MNLGDEHDYNMPNALFLADVLERSAQTHTQANAAAELRRLHAENRALTDALFQAQEAAKALLAQRDALLEALHDIAEFSLEQPTKAVARAAIKAAEENT